MIKHSNTLLNMAAILILGGLFLMTGCSGDDPAAPVVPTDKALWEAVQQMPDSWWGFDRSEENIGATHLPFPDSPEQVMENFLTVYENMDVGGYLQIMHPDFQTVLQQETIENFPDVGPTLDRYEEQNIHKRMFLGQPVTDPNGDLIPGISQIDFAEILQLDVWQATPEEGIFPNSQMAPFQVHVYFDRGQTFSTLIVEGMIQFYVVSREFEFNGTTRQYYQMIGQMDLTGSLKATEDTSWGTVKALFR